MKNPFRMFHVVRIVWKARRPSTITDMPAIVDAFWIKSGYEALTFFGTILTHNSKEAAHLNGKLNALKNHEMIHLKQAVTTGDSWWKFYRLYLQFWWKARRSRLCKNAGYELNPFEMEAYEHMHDLSYLEQCRDGATEWKRFAKMTLEERMKYKKYRLT